MQIDIGFWNKDGDYIEDIQVVDLIEENKLLKEQLYDVAELKKTIENLLEENKELRCEVEQLRQQLK